MNKRLYGLLAVCALIISVFGINGSAAKDISSCIMPGYSPSSYISAEADNVEKTVRDEMEIIQKNGGTLNNYNISPNNASFTIIINKDKLAVFIAETSKLVKITAQNMNNNNYQINNYETLQKQYTVYTNYLKKISGTNVEPEIITLINQQAENIKRQIDSIESAIKAQDNANISVQLNIQKKNYMQVNNWPRNNQFAFIFFIVFAAFAILMSLKSALFFIIRKIKGSAGSSSK